MEPSKNPNEIDTTTTDNSSSDTLHPADYGQYYSPTKVMVTSGEIPDNTVPFKPKRPTWLKILLAFFWVSLGVTVLATIMVVVTISSDPVAGAGAGWALLITVPGILLNLASLIIIYIAEWFVKRSQAKQEKVQNNGVNVSYEGSPDNGKGLMRFAIIYGIVVALFAIYQVTHTIMIGLGYWDFGNAVTEGLIPIAGALVIGGIGLVGLVIVILNKALTGRRKQIAVALFLSPMIAAAAHSQAISTFMSDSGAYSSSTRTNQIKRLTFKPLLLPKEFVGKYNMQQKYPSVNHGKLYIRSGEASENSTVTYLTMSQVNVDDADKLEGNAETCRGSNRDFTTSRGIEVSALVYESVGGYPQGRYCFSSDGVRVSLQLVNVVALQNEQAVSEFIDSLRSVSPEEISAYYSK